jgi:poly-gamma-glutamate capsule biosynthesis protein CapA/YwtB (metallophosphatase superfamily)
VARRYLGRLSTHADTGATIGLLGDVMLGRGVARRLEDVAAERVWSADVIQLCAACDAVICNLECCVSDRGFETGRIPGKPFFFRAPPVAVGALTALGVGGVSLANNHALDCETGALADTLEHLHAAGIATAGAGAHEHAARRGMVVEAGSLRLGVVAATDHPREYAAGPDEPGVAWADLPVGLPPWVREELRRLRAEADLVIAFPHWGPNMTTEPARWQRKRARELVEAGAELVAGHSAHVFHGVEQVDGRPVLYDLGDALDDYALDDELRNDLGILVLWRPGADPALEVVALRLEFCATAVASGADADWVAERMRRACSRLGAKAERVSEARLQIR